MASERTPLLQSEPHKFSIDKKDGIEEQHSNQSYEEKENHETITAATTWPSIHYDGYQTNDYSGGTVKQNPKYFNNKPYNMGVNNTPSGLSMVVTNYDQILVHIGDIGWWQMLIVALLCFPSIAGGILVLLTNFTALEPEAFRCAIPECDGTDARYADLQLRKHTINATSNMLCTLPVVSEIEQQINSNVNPFDFPKVNASDKVLVHHQNSEDQN